MVHCHNCGKELKDSSKYCGACGTKVKGSSKSEENIVIRKKSRFRYVIFYLVLIIIAYMILNLWAIGHVELDTSASSIINSIANFNYGSSLLNTEVSSEIRIRNPTYVPVLITRVSYDLSYGDTVMGEGGTGFIFIMPKSSIDTPINFELNHVNTGKAAIEGIINIFQQEKKSLGMDFYAGFGPIKIPVRELR